MLFLLLGAFCAGFRYSEPKVWGFWAHKRINRLAVFRLPPEMQVFYKPNLEFITENAVNPDKRRYAVVGEAERHFIDLDVYGDSVVATLPKSWNRAIEKFGEDSLRKHGIAPWYISNAVYQLTEAFKDKDAKRILRVSSDLGHYIADIHVPLHTTRNYNGQLTGQEGIHGFWESRLPELFADNYDLWIGEAHYINAIPQEIWQTVADSHVMVDSVLSIEKHLTDQFKKDQKYSYELRNNILTKTYSAEFSTAYHTALRGQVQKRMKAAITLVADLWYTCWVNAGQPNLANLGEVSAETHENEESAESDLQHQRILKVRPEPEN